MGNAIFLIVAILASVVGSLVLWLRHRKPTSFMSSIDDFQREMTALGREQDEKGGRWRRSPKADLEGDAGGDLSGRR